MGTQWPSLVNHTIFPYRTSDPDAVAAMAIMADGSVEWFILVCNIHVIGSDDPMVKR
jgi:hypothetical protein